MADKREDEVRERQHRFINEKIIRQPLSRRQILRRVLGIAFCGALFGVVAAVCFVVSAPAVHKLLGRDPLNESSQITISKDEPDTTAPAETEASSEELETEPVDEMIRQEIARYHYTAEDLNKLYNSLRTIVGEADASVVSVHSIQREKDWFDNPIETTGQFSGVIIARTRTVLLVLTSYEAVEAADSIEVVLTDGTVLDGSVKQSDSVAGMAVVEVDGSGMDPEQFKKMKAIPLGNSYSVKQGDLVVAVGAPAGMVHSSDYGFISYVVRNVQTEDGSARVFYTDAAGDAEAGTFLLNIAGELIGWATSNYDQEDRGTMTRVMAVSDYKGVLEMLTNGIPVPYFGIRGQEVSQAMEESGMPKGIYVSESVSGSPAYNAGIQPGDVITWVNGQQVGTMKDFQNQIEKLKAGDPIKAAVRRNNGKNEYKEIEFDVTIGAR